VKETPAECRGFFLLQPTRTVAAHALKFAGGLSTKLQCNLQPVALGVRCEA
jgi:hypothetical protein